MLETYNEKAERAVLGSLLVGKEIDLLIKELKPEYFYFSKHTEIFKAIHTLFLEGVGIDLVTVSDKLSAIGKLEFVGNHSYLAELSIEYFSLGALLQHAKIIKEKYKMREVMKCLYENYTNAQEGRIATSEELLSNVSVNLVKHASENIKEKVDIESCLNDFTDMQVEYANNELDGKKTIGIPTGYDTLDKLTDGWREEHFITIAAASSVGKSTMAINIAYNLLQQGKRVVIFSMEMSKNDMISKFLGIHMNMAPIVIMKSLADNVFYEKQKIAKEWMIKQRLTMYSDIDDVDEIAMAMRIEESKEHVDLFIIDYLQNISSEKHRDNYTLLTNGVKLLQKTNRMLKTTLLCLSQISIDAKKSKETLNIEGKETGAIKNASNLFIYIKRDVDDENEINQIIQSGSDMPLLCVVNKNRHGSIGAFKLNMKLTSGVIFEPY